MKRWLIPLILPALLAGCSSESSPEPEVAGEVRQLNMTVHDLVPDNEVRAAYTTTVDAMTFAWTKTDTIGICPKTGGHLMLPTSGEATEDVRHLKMKDDQTYAAYYPYNANHAKNEHPYSAIPISYLGQRQRENGSTGEMARYDYMIAKMTKPQDGSLNLTFQHTGAALSVSLACPVEETFTELVLTVPDKLWPADAIMNLSTGRVTMTGHTDNLSIALDSIHVDAGKPLQVWLMVGDADLNAQNISAYAAGLTGGYEANLDGRKFRSGKVYRLQGQLTNVSDGLEHEYVDLGLPSGTLWATTNVGASSPEEPGDYFSWGETRGYKSGKRNFSWGNYRYYKDKQITKYCYDEYGERDNRTELEAIDDAATMNWGRDWQMPSREQLKELATECIWTRKWLGINNIVYVKSKVNGNTITLPSTGDYVGQYIANDDIGSYWSRSIGEDNSLNAASMYFLTIEALEIYHDNIERVRGSCVRPVRRQNNP